MESARSATALARLAALKEHLTGRGITTRMDPGSLAVLASGGEQLDTITCKPWPVDRDAWWYFDCEDRPIAQGDNVVDAALVILGTMARSGLHA